MLSLLFTPLIENNNSGEIFSCGKSGEQGSVFYKEETELFV